MFFDLRRRLSYALLMLCGLIVQASHAGNQYINNDVSAKDAPEFSTAYFVTLSAGPVWTDGGETQTFYLQPDLKKAYIAYNHTPALAEGALFFGMVTNPESSL